MTTPTKKQIDEFETPPTGIVDAAYRILKMWGPYILPTAMALFVAWVVWDNFTENIKMTFSINSANTDKQAELITKTLTAQSDSTHAISALVAEIKDDRSDRKARIQKMEDVTHALLQTSTDTLTAIKRNYDILDRCVREKEDPVN